jgi:bifunctional pyridoxal-dependent enzyme with beta-cystathionase and maltose regulon repressor activities
MTAGSGAGDAGRLARHFECGAGLLPLWIAEPYLPLAPEVSAVLRGRADVGWYETRPRDVIESFWSWMNRRHGWDASTLQTMVSPSVGRRSGCSWSSSPRRVKGFLQPPVFTDFKPLITRAGRSVVRIRSF